MTPAKSYNLFQENLKYFFPQKCNSIAKHYIPSLKGTGYTFEVELRLLF